MMLPVSVFIFFFFNDTATTEIYTLSLHDALPISPRAHGRRYVVHRCIRSLAGVGKDQWADRSEEHTSELQSRLHLVCRLLLEKKKKQHTLNSDILPKTTSVLATPTAQMACNTLRG